jgi:hypothetical protein
LLTVVQSLFSMSFFDFSPDEAGPGPAWRVSDRFWIYWVVTLPITMCTIAWWSYWQRKLVQRHDRGDIAALNGTGKAKQSGDDIEMR